MAMRVTLVLSGGCCLGCAVMVANGWLYTANQLFYYYQCGRKFVALHLNEYLLIAQSQNVVIK